MSAPLVGIALAAFKPNVDFFRLQLKSITDQTYQNWFCVVGFDSPIEDVRAQLNDFFADARFEFVQNPKTLGLVGNFEATGMRVLKKSPKYFAYSDQDDVWHNDKIAKLVSELQTKPAMSVVHCDMQIEMKQHDGSFKILEQTAWQLEKRGVHNVSSSDLFVRNVAAGAGMLMDADLVRRYPKIPGKVYGQDHWYPLVASYFGGVHALNESLYNYRIHGNNIAGIGPYQGFFSASRSSSQLGVVRKCILGYNSSRERLEEALKAGLPVTFMQKLVIAARLDFGLGYFVKAVTVLAADRALARACVARALGKIFGLFKPSYSEANRN